MSGVAQAFGLSPAGVETPPDGPDRLTARCALRFLKSPKVNFPSFQKPWLFNSSGGCSQGDNLPPMIASASVTACRFGVERALSRTFGGISEKLKTMVSERGRRAAESKQHLVQVFIAKRIPGHESKRFRLRERSTESILQY